MAAPAGELGDRGARQQDAGMIAVVRDQDAGVGGAGRRIQRTVARTRSRQRHDDQSSGDDRKRQANTLGQLAHPVSSPL